MKEYRPINVLFFLLFTCSLLLPIVYFAPDDGYEIFGKNLKFLTWENLITPKNQQKKNIDFLDDVDVSDINDESCHARLDSSKAELGLPSKSSVLAVASQTHLEQNDEAKVNLNTFFSNIAIFFRNIYANKFSIMCFCHFTGCSRTTHWIYEILIT